MTAANPSSNFSVEVHDSVRLVRISRPERRNAQTVDMWRELRAIGREFSRDSSVHALVIAGSPESFSSGLDLKEVEPGRPVGDIIEAAHGNLETAADMVGDLQEMFLWIQASRLPVVAAIRGLAIGGGLELALSCDVRIVGTSARLVLPEVAMGVVPDLGGCHNLRALIGYERAFDLVIAGRSISGEEAVAMGLALRAAPDELVEEAALEYASTLSALSPEAVSYAKRALRESRPATSLRIAAQGMASGLRTFRAPSF